MRGTYYHLIAVTALLLCVIFAGGCASNDQNDLNQIDASIQKHFDDTCGNPTRFPVSQACLDLFPYPKNALLQQKSDLVISEWRACIGTDVDPCLSAPACQKETAILNQLVSTNQGPTKELDNADSACKQDYSCHALHTDVIYARHEANLGQEQSCEESNHCDDFKGDDFSDCLERCELLWGEPTYDDCQKAKADIASFNQKIQDAEIQQAFGPAAPIITPLATTRPSILIEQQAVPASVFAPPPTPSFTHCTTFDGSVNCITH